MISSERYDFYRWLRSVGLTPASAIDMVRWCHTLDISRGEVSAYAFHLARGEVAVAGNASKSATQGDVNADAS